MKNQDVNIAIAKYFRWNTDREQLGGVFIYRRPDGNIAASLPHYAESIDTCEEIFRLLRDEERQIEMTMTNESWHVRISDNEGDSFITVVGELNELPRVVCQAFLTYKGEWKETT